MQSFLKIVSVGRASVDLCFTLVYTWPGHLLASLMCQNCEIRCCSCFFDQAHGKQSINHVLSILNRPAPLSICFWNCAVPAVLCSWNHEWMLPKSQINGSFLPWSCLYFQKKFVQSCQCLPTRCWTWGQKLGGCDWQWFATHIGTTWSIDLLWSFVLSPS